MDLGKIGKYIASKRKALGMTQKQLAELLDMSDKSVSKWERGICLPDVSLYCELCRILGISINEFLAGEDIPHENVVQKSEENIIGVATVSKQKQNRLKTIICALLIVSLLALSVIAVAVYLKVRPQNYLEPLSRDSIEIQTAELLLGPDQAHIYRFSTSDEYSSFSLSVSTYHSGELIEKAEALCLGFDGIGSPESGEILIVPDFDDYAVKIVFVANETKYSNLIHILEGVADRAYYGRSSSEIREKSAIRYNEEQALVALIYDNDEMRVLDLGDLMSGETDSLEQNDWVYFLSFEFSKE